MAGDKYPPMPLDLPPKAQQHRQSKRSSTIVIGLVGGGWIIMYDEIPQPYRTKRPHKSRKHRKG